MFPEFFGDDLNYLNRVREYLQLRCEIEIDPNNVNLQAMESVQAYFINEQKPHTFDPYEKENVISVSEQQFENVCNTMEDQGSHKPKELTEFEFYHKLRFYEKKFKAKADAAK